MSQYDLESTPIALLIPKPSLRRALGIALDVIGFSERAGYPFPQHLREAKPFIKAEYLAQGGFDGEDSVARCTQCNRVVCEHDMKVSSEQPAKL